MDPAGCGRGVAEDLDRDDELAGFRDRFVVDDSGPIYVDGNSLGRLPRSTSARLAAVVEDEWGRGLIGSWARWIDRAAAVGDLLAEHVLGARSGEVVVSDSTTVNLYKLAAAALDARPGRSVLVTDVGNFPSDRFVAEGLAHARGLELRWVEADPDPSAIEVAVARGDVALVTLSAVSYHTGALLDVAAITAAAHAGGALVLWDLSHAAGAVPLELEADGVDVAVGCTYKYLNGGPGAPAFLYVRRELQDEMRQPIWGWFGAADQFGFGPAYVPAEGIERFQVGTPPILALAAVQEGVALIADARIDRLRAKSVVMTEMMISFFDGELAPLGIGLATPRLAARRGSHLALRHPDAWRICRALIEEMGVVPDFRAPDVIRFGIAPLYTRFVDGWDAVDRLRAVVREGRHESYPVERSRVT